MDKEIETLRTHAVYELVLCVPSMCTLHLGWVLHWRLRNGTFEKNRALGQTSHSR